MIERALFRGKCVYAKYVNPSTGEQKFQWTMGTLSFIYDIVKGKYVPRRDKAIITGQYGPNEVLYDTLCQYTGCKDKNGVEIFTGDIVECCSYKEFFSDAAGKPMEPFRRKMVVDFRNGGFKMIEHIGNGLPDNVWNIIYDGDVVVLGNIYDNPDLLDYTPNILDSTANAETDIFSKEFAKDSDAYSENDDENNDEFYKQEYEDYLLICDNYNIEPEDFDVWLPKEHMRQYMIRQCAKD